MKVIHFLLVPRSRSVTRFRGDILLGQLFWQYRYRNGPEKLGELLAKIDHTSAPVISDLFPKGFLPIPRLRRTPKPEDRKQLKALSYLPIPQWETLRSNLTPETLTEALYKFKDEQQPAPALTEDMLHATINRLSGTTTDEGGLYSRESTFYDKNLEFHGYFYPGSIDVEEGIDLLHEIGSFGYGADASTGAGTFDLTILEKQLDWESPENANGWMALSHHLPDARLNAQKGSYGIKIHYGRLGGDFATAGNPFKKPLLLFEPGSLWKPKPEPDSLYGIKLDKMHVNREEVCHVGYTLPFAVHWEDN